MRLIEITRSALKHLVMRNDVTYKKVLSTLQNREDIWKVSQGDYMRWWLERAGATLTIAIRDGQCTIKSSLENAVFEKYPDEFLDEPTLVIDNVDFSGEVWINIDPDLEHKELLIDFLKREGILNYRIAKDGVFQLNDENLGSLLAEIHHKLKTRSRPFETDISALRQIIIEQLDRFSLPLIRIWYHPRIKNTIVKAVFSPRYDVDRAIVNLPRIRKLEQKYNVGSTMYVRAFCPFYAAADIQAFAESQYDTEIGLHGEFVRNARTYGDEYAAAQAEKQHLEELIDRPVVGLCMHGGEFTKNETENSIGAADQAGLMYDTTANMYYFLPYRPMIDGQLRSIYRLHHTLGDIRIPTSLDFSQVFYRHIIEEMDRIYAQHGVFVLLLHPVYFGFFNYILRPKYLIKLIKFFLYSSKRTG